MKMSAILNDPAIKTFAHGDMQTFPAGLQPFLFVSGEGTVLAQLQSARPPRRLRKMSYFQEIDTIISRDGGRSYHLVRLDQEREEPYFEGGMAQLSDGTIYALDTYVLQEDETVDDWGAGEVWMSRDDLRTFEPPQKATFHIPKLKFDLYDDGGNPHRAARLHRTVLELPDGTMLLTMYPVFKGDVAPAGYEPKMTKSRVILLRSVNKGMHWEYVTTIATDIGIGTEGFGEPCLVYISKGKHSGRLLCIMRTGRELYESYSDDGGETWSDYRIVKLPIDIYAVSTWREQFYWRYEDAPPNMKSLAGAMVDPDIIQMGNGLLVLSFGVRIPEKLCWGDPTHPVNGIYCAFSKDGGETWSHVIQLMGGTMTTHYTGVRELGQNRLLYHYDVGVWGPYEPDKKDSRHGRACYIDVEYTG